MPLGELVVPYLMSPPRSSAAGRASDGPRRAPLLPPGEPRGAREPAPGAADPPRGTGVRESSSPAAPAAPEAPAAPARPAAGGARARKRGASAAAAEESGASARCARRPPQQATRRGNNAVPRSVGPAGPQALPSSAPASDSGRPRRARRCGAGGRRVSRGRAVRFSWLALTLRAAEAIARERRSQPRRTRARPSQPPVGARRRAQFSAAERAQRLARFAAPFRFAARCPCL